MHSTRGEKIFQICNYIILTIVGLISLYPLVYVLAASFSSGDAIMRGEVLLFPKEFTIEAYQKVLSEKAIWMGYANTFFYTIVGTSISMFVTICGAYPLSKKGLPGRKLFTLMAVFVMWVKPGMIPTYLNFRDLGLMDSRWALLLGFACTTFNFILLRTFFESVPDSLEEAAKADSASDFQVLTKVYLPLSKPALATVGLFYAVARWNGYFWAMILMRDDSKVPLQVVLKTMITELQHSSEALDIVTNLSIETYIFATIIISIVPMVALYPFISKYFQKGVMLGAVKG